MWPITAQHISGQQQLDMGGRPLPDLATDPKPKFPPSFSEQPMDFRNVVVVCI